MYLIEKGLMLYIAGKYSNSNIKDFNVKYCKHKL